MTNRRHDPVTQSIHWLIALAIVAAYGIGLMRDSFAKGDPRTFITMIHMSLGVLVIALSVVRIGWRSFTPALPPVPAAKPVLLAAKAAHLLLYVAMIAVPLIGMIMVWAKGRGIVVFGLFTIPAPMAANKGLGKLLEEAHEIAAHLMMLTAGLHAAAAIGHQFLLKDGTLGRMLPFLKAGAAPAPR